MQEADGNGFSGGDGDRVERSLSAVQRHMDSGKLDQAKEVCHQILKEAPFHSEPYNRLGIIACMEGQHELAGEYLKTAIQLNDKIPDYHLNLCLCAMQLGDLAGAENGLRRVLELDPEHIEANLQCGLMLCNQKQFAAAALFFEKVLALDPGNVEAQARLAMGKVCANLDNIDLAYDEAHAALKGDPDNRTALQTIFALLLVQHRSEEALDYGEKLVKLEPRNAEYRKNLDIAYKQLLAKEDA